MFGLTYNKFSFSLRFTKSEIFSSPADGSYHMEIDLFTNDGSILYEDNRQLKTTDGTKTSVVASGFQFPNDFRQLNATHVVVVDLHLDCLKIVNRKNKSNKVLAGECGVDGFVDGASARFYYPAAIELDKRNPGHLLVADRNNGALRTVDVASGVVSTVRASGFRFPDRLAWHNDRLLVANSYYISEVVWGANGFVTNNRLAGTTNSGYKDGDFPIAKFTGIEDIQQLRDGLFLIADYSNKRLRLLDMFTKKVLPVCIGVAVGCSTGTSLSFYPQSLMIYNERLYVGGTSGDGIILTQVG